MARQGHMFRLTITLLVIFVIVFYAIFNTRLIIKGPSVQIYDLKDGQVIEGDGLVEIKGEAQNISFISLNGRQIFVDESRHFSEKLLLTSQINPIEVFVSDKFGKQSKAKITLIYKTQNPVILPIQTDIKEATSTDASSTQEIAPDNT